MKPWAGSDLFGGKNPSIEEVMLEQYGRQYDLNGCCLRAPWIMRFCRRSTARPRRTCVEPLLPSAASVILRLEDRC